MGGGLEIRLNFSEVDIGLQPHDFRGYSSMVKSMYKRNGTLSVDLRHVKDIGGWAGNQTYRLKGEIISDECEWSFSGYVGAYDNPFDFNSLPWGVRKYWKEVVTRLIGSVKGGQDYNISFRGNRPVYDGGKW